MKKAVLLIHGLAGGTYDLENLTNHLEINDFDTFTFTLPGHDKKVKVTKEDWINSSEEHLQKIIDSGYKEIYVVGHSMGGVLAARLASKHKEVKKLVLAAAAFKYMPNESGKFDILELLKKGPEIIKSYTGSVVMDRLLKLHPACLKEFMDLVEENQNVLGNITCPVLIIQGFNDNLVPISSSKMIYNKVSSKVKILCLCDNCNHHIFISKNKDEIIKYITKFLNKKIYIKKKLFISI